MKKIPAIQEIKTFRKRLLLWFDKHQRDYPWRKTDNPFKILIAEMMLQRTKADQVQSVYLNFFSHFKTQADVASVNMRKLNRLLYPLGLHWRIKKFKEVSKALVSNFNGKVPESRELISRLPGVGDYVAGIVLSVAFDKKEWIVDSNVVRVFKRYFGILTSKEGRRDRHVIDIARIYVNCNNPRNANLALLDFAALVCTPSKPEHERCPLYKNCHYFLHI